jgi:hypothetical protein
MSDWNPTQIITDVTLTYLSADSPVFVASTSTNISGSVSLGMRVRLTQITGGTKYFIVVAISSSTITLYGGSDYALVDEAISSPMFSALKAPYGFPLNPEKWTLTTTDNQARSQSNPSNGTWYNVGGLSLEIHIGLWNVEYFVNTDVIKISAVGADVYVTLSTANNSESDPSMTSRNYIGSASGNLDSLTAMSRARYISLSDKTTYYLNAKTTTSPTSISFHGEDGLTVIRAVCAYL